MTGISWTDATWNPVVGCSKVSPACDNCYAERMARRQVAMGNYPENIITGQEEPRFSDGRWSGEVATFPERLDQPLRWRKPRRVFVVSMGDLFHENVPTAFIDRVWDVMAAAQLHTFQVLTKRPSRMRDFLKYGLEWMHDPLPNVWLGVTAENQEQADIRIPVLLDTPAAVRFVSVEPMLGEVDLTHVKLNSGWDFSALKRTLVSTSDQAWPPLDWVICGGESGPGARPMNPEWVRSLRDQCQAAGVPFHFKQWGPNKAAGRWLDGREWLEFPNDNADRAR